MGMNLKICLDLLRKLNSINRAIQKVGHEVFYIPELTDRVDVRKDYFRWLIDSSNKVRIHLKTSLIEMINTHSKIHFLGFPSLQLSVHFRR